MAKEIKNAKKSVNKTANKTANKTKADTILDQDLNSITSEDLGAQLLALILTEHAQAQYQRSEVSKNGFRRCARRVPEIRAILKIPLIKALGQLPANKTILLWHDIFLSTDSYELASLALYFYQHRTLQEFEFKKIKLWVRRCDCWEHSDDLSKIFAHTLEQNPEWVLPVLEKWNGAKNPWQRRQSVVSLLEYTQKRQSVQPFDTLISFVLPLLDDDEYYVQKGVGWTLREIFNAHPEQTIEFFTAYLLKIQPLAWSAATEKLDKPLKLKFNEQRKLARTLTSTKRGEN